MLPLIDVILCLCLVQKELITQLSRFIACRSTGIVAPIAALPKVSVLVAALDIEQAPMDIATICVKKRTVDSMLYPGSYQHSQLTFRIGLSTPQHRRAKFLDGISVMLTCEHTFKLVNNFWKVGKQLFSCLSPTIFF